VTIARQAAIGVLRGYQLFISPLLGPSCRFHPSCSHYACGAIRRHGVAKGGYLAVARLLRCHPWAAWGDDPVPERFTFQPWRIKNAGFDGEG
jgi:putative membrane protein insertion efficiency factor